MGQVKFFKSCLPQILFGPFLNTLSHLTDLPIAMERNMQSDTPSKRHKQTELIGRQKVRQTYRQTDSETDTQKL